MGGFFEGKPFEYFNNLPQYQKDLQAGTSGLALQQLGQPNTAMPEEMYKAVMMAYGVPTSMYDAMNIMQSMMGTNPVQTNPFSTFQPTGSAISYTPGAQDPASTPPDYSGWNKQFDDPDRDVWRPGGNQVPGGPGRLNDPDNPDAGGPRYRFSPIRGR